MAQSIRVEENKGIRKKQKNKEKIQKNKVKFGVQGKLLGLLLPIVVLVIGVILTLVYSTTSSIVLDKSEQMLRTNTTGAVSEIEAWREQTLLLLETERSTMEYFDLYPEQELAYIRHTEGRYNAFPSGIYLGITDGQLKHASFVPDASYNMFEKVWYTLGVVSEEFVFGPVYFDAASKSNVISASAQIKDQLGRVRGVMAADIYLTAISDIVKQVQIEQTGGMLLVDKDTDIMIGHQDSNLVGTALKAQEDELYRYISNAISQGLTGLQTCTKANGEQVYIDIAQVPNSQWVAVSYVPSEEIMGDLNTLTQNIILLAIAAIAVLSLLIILMIRRTVIRPVKSIDHVARRIADGQLNESIDYQSSDEFGALAINFNQTVTRLREYVLYIDEISAVLNEIAHGNLNFHLTQAYTGEFEKVKSSLENIANSLNTTIGKINLAAYEVTGNSEHLSGGAQALSQGATEQASAIEELAATIAEVSEQIQKNAANAQKAKLQSIQVGDEISLSNGKMENMIGAITQISEKSGQIHKIIKTIEDIAFQTNILALNAAVEAARAGAAGKGFAVVADEVRNLASKSSEAAKNTTTLIEETVKAVENGTYIAGDTAKSMEVVVENTKVVTGLVEEIAHASDEQAGYIAQVSEGIMQISNVVQTNSATAQESAAASEELLGQAQMLKNLVGQFKLKNQQDPRQR